MKRFLTPALRAFLLSGPPQFTVADCYTLSTVTGQVFRFTSFDQNLVIAPNASINQPGGTFDSMGSRVSRGRIETKRGFETSTLEVTIASDVTPDLNGGALVAPPSQLLTLSLNQAAIAGLLYGATVRLETVYGDPVSGGGLTRLPDASYNDGGWGSLIKYIGLVGDIEVIKQDFKITCSSYAHYLEPTWPPFVIQPACRWRLFDFGCANLQVGTGSIGANSANLTIGSGITLDAGSSTGRPVTIAGAGVGGANLVTTIKTVTDASHAVLTDASTVAVGPGAVVTIGLLAANFAVPGVVQAGSTVMVVQHNLPNPSGYFTSGRIVMQSGKNQGLTRMIKGALGAGASADYPTTVLNDTPYVFLRLNDAVGSALALDSSGNGYNGTVHNTLTFGQTSLLVGDKGTGALFDGSSSYISVPAPKPSNFKAGITFEFWYSLSLGAGGDQPRGIFDSNAGAVLSAAGLPGVLRNSGEAADTLPGFEWYKDRPFVGIPAPAAQSSQHVVVVFRGAQSMDVYVNGQLFDSETAAGPGDVAWNNPFWVGRTGGGHYYDGILQDFAVYNYPLSADQVFTHYLAGTTAPSAGTANGIFLLLTPLLFAPAAGDTFLAFPGCDKTVHTCTTKFKNILQYGGQPYTPQPERGI